MADSSRPAAAGYVGVLSIQWAVGAASFGLAAGSLNVPRGILYFALQGLVSAAGGLYLYRTRAETLAARRRVAEGTPAWDRAILAAFVPLAYCGVYLAAGLPHRLGRAYPPMALYWAGLALSLAGSALTVWAVKVNRHFESSVRIQTDRGHAVCSDGPYALVRHPGYAALILWALGLALMFGPYAALAALGVTALLVARTGLEDTLLQRRLPGYGRYAAKVKYRLLPPLW